MEFLFPAIGFTPTGFILQHGYHAQIGLSAQAVGDGVSHSPRRLLFARPPIICNTHSAIHSVAAALIAFADLTPPEGQVGRSG